MPKSPHVPFSSADSFRRGLDVPYSFEMRPDRARRAGSAGAHTRRLKQIEARLAKGDPR
jgi:hypothetical protein